MSFKSLIEDTTRIIREKAAMDVKGIGNINLERPVIVLYFGTAREAYPTVNVRLTDLKPSVSRYIRHIFCDNGVFTDAVSGQDITDEFPDIVLSVYEVGNPVDDRSGSYVFCVADTKSYENAEQMHENLKAEISQISEKLDEAHDYQFIWTFLFNPADFPRESIYEVLKQCGENKTFERVMLISSVLIGGGVERVESPINHRMIGNIISLTLDKNNVRNFMLSPGLKTASISVEERPNKKIAEAVVCTVLNNIQKHARVMTDCREPEKVLQGCIGSDSGLWDLCESFYSENVSELTQITPSVINALPASSKVEKLSQEVNLPLITMHCFELFCKRIVERAEKEIEGFRFDLGISGSLTLAGISEEYIRTFITEPEPPAILMHKTKDKSAQSAAAMVNPGTRAVLRELHRAYDGMIAESIREKILEVRKGIISTLDYFSDLCRDSENYPIDSQFSKYVQITDTYFSRNKIEVDKKITDLFESENDSEKVYRHILDFIEKVCSSDKIFDMSFEREFTERLGEESFAQKQATILNSFVTRIDDEQRIPARFRYRSTRQLGYIMLKESLDPKSLYRAVESAVRDSGIEFELINTGRSDSADSIAFYSVHE